MPQDANIKQAKLRTLLDNLGRLMVEPSRNGEDFARARAQAEKRDLAEARATVLERERIMLTAEVRHCLLHDIGLKRTPSMVAVHRWLDRDNAPPVILLSGPPGCGKTVAAASAFVDKRVMARSCKWRPASQVVRTFASLFGSAAGKEQQQLEDTHLLVLEDVGVEAEPARMASALVELLEQRGKDVRLHRTIITTNLRQDDFVQRYDTRLTSRLSPKFAAWAYSAGEDLRQP